ncbi:hypothetical protein Q3G72_019671 [Acer saccharum]|nr:hypothetical protein Q3G72_019671 [Acer saccharum]
MSPPTTTTTKTVSDPPLDSGQEFKKRNKSKEKFEFDENNAQIFRLKPDDAHLQSRIYFKEYCNSFIYSFVAFSCLLLYIYLDGNRDSGILSNVVVVVIVLGFVSLCKVLIVLARVVSFEKSASKSVLDFDFGSIEGFGRFSVAVLMGCVVAFLYMPAGKNARSFWLGSNQLRSNLVIFSCG